jgi:hypothetical protein
VNVEFQVSIAGIAYSGFKRGPAGGWIDDDRDRVSPGLERALTELERVLLLEVDRGALQDPEVTQ